MRKSVAICCLLSAVLPAAGQKPPNIVLVITDDHAVQAFGTGEKDSPVPLAGFSRLAREGRVFDRSYCCNALCGPSRASILTGLHSHTNGFLYNERAPFNGAQPTFPKALHAAGYATAYFGKWHLDSDPTGFDTWKVFRKQGNYFAPEFLTGDLTGKKTTERTTGYATDLVTAEALGFLAARDKTKPFMMVVGHKAPHRPWCPAPRHLGRAKAWVEKLTPPATLMDDWKNRPYALALNEMSIAHHFRLFSDHHLLVRLVPKDISAALAGAGDRSPLDEMSRMTPAERAAWTAYHAERTRDFVARYRAGEFADPQKLLLWHWRTYMEDYLGTLLAVSESLERLLDALDAEGLSENTLFVYCGDQGFYLGEHGWFDKRWIFEESMRMPLAMRWPGRIPAGTHSQAIVQNIDYAPTFCALAGVPYAAQGRDLTAPMEGHDEDFLDRTLYYAYYENPGVHNVARHDGIRSGRWTFARFQPPAKWPAGRPFTFADEWMLIDNERDPQQLRNVAGEPAYAEDFARLKQLYETTRKAYGAK